MSTADTHLRISTRDLCPGMFLVRMDASWWKHPFFQARNRFIQTFDEVAEIRRFVEYVIIDCAKSQPSSLQGIFGRAAPRASTQSLPEPPRGPAGETAANPEVLTALSAEPSESAEPPSQCLDAGLELGGDELARLWKHLPSDEECRRQADQVAASRRERHASKREDVREKVVSRVTGSDKGVQLVMETIEHVHDLMDDARMGRSLNHERSKQQVAEIMKMYLASPSTVLALCTLKTQDEYTYQHCVNVSILSMAFARYLGMSAVSMADVGLAGLYHDLGKAKMPGEILKKPGKLSSDEYEIMKTHPVKGFHLLDTTDDLPGCVALAALQHHERADGSGYPQGLKGDAICREARIVGLADMYDAMTSDRVYHRAKRSTDVLKMLFSDRDRTFGSQQVEHFIRCLGIYPPGTFVQLSTGFGGVVVDRRGVVAHLPLVKVFFDSSFRLVPEHEVDLAESESHAHGEVRIMRSFGLSELETLVPGGLQGWIPALPKAR